MVSLYCYFLLTAMASVVSTGGTDFSRCLPSSQLTFTLLAFASPNATEAEPFIYSLSNLCRPKGEDYFVWQYYNNVSFNIGGDVSSTCSWQPGRGVQYTSTGAAIQWLGPAPTNDPNNPCYDADSGNPISCSQECEVLASSKYFNVSLLDAHSPNGSLVHDS